MRNRLREICSSPLKHWHEEVQQIGALVSDHVAVTKPDDSSNNNNNGTDHDNDNIADTDKDAASSDAALVRAEYLSLSLQLCLEQPLKTPFVAAVALIVNIRHPDVVAELLEKAAGIVEWSVATGEWREAKLALKLLACMHSCLEGAGLFTVLEELFSRAVDLQTASSDDVRESLRRLCRSRRWLSADSFFL